jgi:hypothetical protein
MLQSYTRYPPPATPATPRATRWAALHSCPPASSGAIEASQEGLLATSASTASPPPQTHNAAAPELGANRSITRQHIARCVVGPAASPRRRPPTKPASRREQGLDARAWLALRPAGTRHRALHAADIPDLRPRVQVRRQAGSSWCAGRARLQPGPRVMHHTAAHDRPCTRAAAGRCPAPLPGPA